MTQSFNHGYALLIGVGACKYTDWSLPATVKDMAALRNLLVDPALCAYPDNEEHVRLLHDEGATGQAILDGLSWLGTCAQQDPDATIVIYYSGHGWLDEETGRYFLIPHDVTPFDLQGSALPADDFNAALRAIPAKRLLVFIDSCHAEGMATAKAAGALKLPPGFAKCAPPDDLLAALKEGEGRAVFTSSRGHQQSWVRTDSTLSIFTYHLLEALQGAANQPSDTVVRLSNLMNHLDRTVPATAMQMAKTEQRPFVNIASEDFPVAMLQGGKGLPAGGWAEVESEAQRTIDRLIHVEGDRNVMAESITDSVVQTGDHATSTGDDIQGDNVYVVKKGGALTVVQSVGQPGEFDADDAEARYLHYLISNHRYLQLQGIRSGGKLVHIELDQIYIRLRATQQRLIDDEERWLREQADLAPGEQQRRGHAHGASMQTVTRTVTETVTVNVEAALADHKRLVVLGDPGSGKTTLLRYLTLLYARDANIDASTQVVQRLGLDESGYLPIYLPLRQVGNFLRSRPDEGADGHRLLLDFFRDSLASERIDVPEDFFDDWLDGKAAIFLDGLDEVADPDLRRRVARLVECFVRAYPDCRYVVTSRIVGYTGAARLGENFTTTTVRDFNLADIERFLTAWHGMLAVGLRGPGPATEAYAADQTEQLLQAIRGNERIRELAINPLMLTVIAMVHRDRVKLPDRRAELYAEALDVLLGKWDEARGVKEMPVLEDRPFDTGDKRLLLQSIALHMHEQERKELAREELRLLLAQLFFDMLNDMRAAEKAAARFLQVVQERAGLLAARGESSYSFTHLTFQEYLAALAVAGEEDYIGYTLPRLSDPWWREVILLQAGYLSTQSKDRTTRLIQAIADRKDESEPYHNLVLAADCLRDVGGNRVIGNLEAQVQSRLRSGILTPPPALSRWLRRFGTVGGKDWIEQRGRAMEALVRIGAGYWTEPYGEPEWVHVPAGEFWMGADESNSLAFDDENPIHKVYLDDYRIAKTPITNAQYLLFVKATDHPVPEYWEDDQPPKGLEAHPVVKVTWHDVIAYCKWLSKVVGTPIRLPSEAEWEKAARGDKDRRLYPWGDEFDAFKCNSRDLGVGGTTPVGIFVEGASSYGALDMSGNVWEWTRSIYADYPYDANDGREDPSADGRRVLRGGSFDFSRRYVRSACRSNGQRRRPPRRLRFSR